MHTLHGTIARIPHDARHPDKLRPRCIFDAFALPIDDKRSIQSFLSDCSMLCDILSSSPIFIPSFRGMDGGFRSLPSKEIVHSFRCQKICQSDPQWIPMFMPSFPRDPKMDPIQSQNENVPNRIVPSDLEPSHPQTKMTNQVQHSQRIIPVRSLPRRGMPKDRFGVDTKYVGSSLSFWEGRKGRTLGSYTMSFIGRWKRDIPFLTISVGPET